MDTTTDKVAMIRLSMDIPVRIRDGETPDAAMERFIGDLCDYDGIPDNALFRGEGRATDDLLSGLFQGARIVPNSEGEGEDEELEGAFSHDFYLYTNGGF